MNKIIKDVSRVRHCVLRFSIGRTENRLHGRKQKNARKNNRNANGIFHNNSEPMERRLRSLNKSKLLFWALVVE